MDWTATIQSVGVPASVLVFLAWCFVQMMRWAGPRIDKMIERLVSAADRIQSVEPRLFKIEADLRTLDERVDTIWVFHLRRAEINIVRTGAGKVNSPLVIHEDAKKWLAALAPALREFWRTVGKNLTPMRAAEEIERRWGPDLIENICAPHGYEHGECLLIAIAVAKSEPEPVGAV